MKWSNLYKMILWFSTISLLLKILGYLLPWWFVVPDAVSKTDRYYVGIVFGLDCHGGITERNCSEYSIGRTPAAIDGLVESASMLTLQIAMSVNLGFLFISCMIIVGSSVARAYNKGLMVMTCILISISCVAYFVSLGFFIYLHVNEINTEPTYDYDAHNFPWSILVTSVAAILLFATLVLIVIALCRWVDDDDSLMTDDDRKIVEYPAETRYVYDNPKHQMYDRPMVHSGSSKRAYQYVERSTPYQQISYPADTMYRPYSARRY